MESCLCVSECERRLFPIGGQRARARLSYERPRLRCREKEVLSEARQPHILVASCRSGSGLLPWTNCLKALLYGHPNQKGCCGSPGCGKLSSCHASRALQGNSAKSTPPSF